MQPSTERSTNTGERPDANVRMTVQEATIALSITDEAVRGSSIHRGKYGRGKAEDGRVFVFLTPDQLMNGREHPAADSAERLAPVRDLWPEKAELVEELRDHGAFLKAEHEARNEEIPRREEEHLEEARRKDTIIAQRVPELPPAFSQEAPGRLERASEASGTVAKGRHRGARTAGLVAVQVLLRVAVNTRRGKEAG